MTRASHAEYQRRFHAALDFIDRNLDQPLDLQTLAALAHFSPYHFYRLFAVWVGETLGEYLRRRRLEMAAVRLRAQPDVPVLHIALAVGFSSAESFARAFRSRFSCTPSAWRNRKDGQAKRKGGQVGTDRSRHSGVLRSHLKETPMLVKLLDRTPVDVAYHRHTGPYGEPLSAFWQKTVYPWMASNNLLGQERYGLSLDDPTVTKAPLCRYDACVVVPARAVLAGYVQRRTIPGGRYAVTRFKGTVSQIATAWDPLLRNWLPGSGLQLDSRPFFEHYPLDAEFDAATGSFSCDLCVPVTSL